MVIANMSREEPIDLYIAQTWPELASKTIEINNQKSYQELVNQTERMWNEANNAQKVHDQEREYVLLVKFIDRVRKLKLMKETKYNKRVEQAFARAQKLNITLKARYEDLVAQREMKISKARHETPYAFDLECGMGNFSNGSPQPNSPTPGPIRMFLEPNQVFNLLRKEPGNVLLVDTRSTTAYNIAHVKVGGIQSIPMPEEILTNDATLDSLGKSISSPEHKGMWERRANYNHLILIDRDTQNFDNVRNSWMSPVALLAKLLRESGLGTISVMSGGFQKWYGQYPTECYETNSGTAVVTSAPTTFQIAYPSLPNDLMNTLSQSVKSRPTQPKQGHRLYPVFPNVDESTSESEYESEEQDEGVEVSAQAPVVVRNRKPQHGSLISFPESAEPIKPTVVPPPTPTSHKPMVGTAPNNILPVKTKVKKQKPNKHLANAYNIHSLKTSLPKYVRRAGLVGLVNVGNTCYLNSIVQCLSNTMPFSTHFIEQTYRKDVNKSNPLGTGGELATVFGDLLKVIWTRSERVTTYKPDRLKNVISKFCPRFAGSEQHDAQELLSFLMDGLHEDLNRSRDRTYKEDPDFNGNDEETAREAWVNYRRRNDSVVVDLFQGQFRSELQCRKCGHSSVTFNPFMYLSVPIPANASRTSLTSCISTFTAKERVTGNDQWYCSKCKKHRDADKKLSIWRLPPVLLIHFKRFASDPFGNLRAKIDTLVDFPTSNLDLTNFVPTNDDQQQHQYHLLSVANHWGQMGSGHYTSFCRNVFDKQWYDFDDSTVKRLDESKIQTPGAYVLSYINADYFKAYNRT
eukprot:CFRG1685T1